MFGDALLISNACKRQQLRATNARQLRASASRRSPTSGNINQRIGLIAFVRNPACVFVFCLHGRLGSFDRPRGRQCEIQYFLIFRFVFFIVFIRLLGGPARLFVCASARERLFKFNSIVRVLPDAVSIALFVLYHNLNDVPSITSSSEPALRSQRERDKR